MARDVGWSIIDTDFRFEMKCFFPFIHLHKNWIKFKITCYSASLIYPALSWFLLFSKDLRVWTSVECLLLIYLFLLLALISNTSYILAGLTTVSWRIVWYQNTMITKLPLMEQIIATLWKRIIEVKICCYKMMVMRYWVQGQIEQVLAVSPCWIVWCVTVATIICTILFQLKQTKVMNFSLIITI